MSSKTNNSGTTSNSFSIGNFETVDGYVKIQALSPTASPTTPPFIGYSEADLKWQFSNNGVDITNIGAGGGVSIHNDLTSIQGGASTERYHLTSAQHSYLTTDGYYAQSSGDVHDINFEDLTGGDIKVFDGYVNLYSTSDFTGRFKLYMIPEKALTVPTDVISYVVASYNSGTPEYSIITDSSLINESDVVALYTFYNINGNLSYLRWKNLGLGLANKLHTRNVKCEKIARESGIILTFPFGQSGNTIEVSDGLAWYGVNTVNLDKSDSSVDLCQYWYYSSGGWVQSLQTTVYTTKYYDSNTFSWVSLSAGKYCVNWVYRDLFTRQMIILLGEGDYSLAEAQASKPPALIPDSAATTMILAGRGIFEAGSTYPIITESAFTVNFSGKPPTNHNGLTNLDGGTTGEYYHLTDNDNTWLTGLVSDGYVRVSKGGTGINVYSVGDILYAPTTDSLAKRAIGSTGQVLTVSGGLPTWASASSVDILNELAVQKGTDYSIIEAINNVTPILNQTQIGPNSEFFDCRKISNIGNGCVLMTTPEGSGYYSAIYKSYDYGNTWIKKYQNVKNICAVTYVGEGICIAALTNSTSVLRSADWGETWSIITSANSWARIIDICASGNGSIIMVGGNNINKKIYRSADKGLTWATTFTGSSGNLICAHYLGNGVVIAGGDNSSNTCNFARSTDYGVNWIESSLEDAAVHGVVTDFCYLGNNNVIAATTSGNAGNRISQSLDLGATWSSGKVLNVTAYSACYLGGGKAIVGTASGKIYQTTDNGSTFSDTGVRSNGLVPINSIVMLEDRTLLYNIQSNTIGYSRESIATNPNNQQDGYIQVIEKGVPKWKTPAFSKWVPLSTNDFSATAASTTELTITNPQAILDITNICKKDIANVAGYPLKTLTLPPDGYCPIYNDSTGIITSCANITNLTADLVPDGSLYITAVDEGGGNYRVDIYNDFRRRATDLIAHSESYNAAGVKNLIANNGSLVGGSITIGVTGADSDMIVECVKYYTINSYTLATNKVALYGPSMLTTANAIKKIWIGTVDLVQQIDFFIPNSYAASAINNVLSGVNNQYYYWSMPPARLTRFTAITKTVATNQPSINILINNSVKASFENSNDGLKLSSAATLYSSNVNLNPKYLLIAKGNPLEITTTQESSGTSEDLSVSCVFVLE